jgi:glycosyltransferase involved in cell wall biosynthesis
MEAVDEVVALPRVTDGEAANEDLPNSLTYRTEGLGGKGDYIWALLRLLATDRGFDVIWCGHVHLVPLALLARQLTGAPIVVHIHGIEIWEPTGRWLVDALVSQIDHFISISGVTKERFVRWSGVAPERGTVVPNTVNFRGLSPGPKPSYLLDRYRLHDRFVLLTLGRMVGKSRRKGFDRVLEVLPDVVGQCSDVTYLAVGKGPDRPRLEQKAERLGVRDRVVFAGYVPEEEKADHFRLADRFVLPSEGEGFGLVLLEALACGTPVVASKIDGGREAVADGEFGRLVNPRKPEELVSAICEEQAPPDPEKVRIRFGPSAYQRRVEEVLHTVASEVGS